MSKGISVAAAGRHHRNWSCSCYAARVLTGGSGHWTWCCHVHTLFSLWTVCGTGHLLLWYHQWCHEESRISFTNISLLYLNRFRFRLQPQLIWVVYEVDVYCYCKCSPSVDLFLLWDETHKPGESETAPSLVCIYIWQTDYVSVTADNLQYLYPSVS